MLKKCARCNSDFQKGYNESKKSWEERMFCSRGCCYEKRCELYCIECGLKYEVQNYRKDKSVYCSKKCMHQSAEHKNRISEGNKGKSSNPETMFKTGHKHSEETKEKMRGKRNNSIPWNKKEDIFISCKECGKSVRVKHCHSNQKYCSKFCSNRGKDLGKTPESKKIRMSTEYKLWRNAVFERDDWTCIWCFQKGGELNADHIKPFALYPELRLAIDNGRTLCRKCHLTTDTFGSKTRRSVYEQLN